MANPWHPTQEQIEAVANTILTVQRSCTGHQNDVGRAWSSARAAISVLAPMVAEDCAVMFDERAALHGRDAKWMGPERQYYSGPRIYGVEMSPMNGPAIAHDRALADAKAIRSRFNLPAK